MQELAGTVRGNRATEMAVCVKIGREKTKALLERQPDGFEIAAVVADPDIAANIDRLVTELHFDTAWKLTAQKRTVW